MHNFLLLPVLFGGSSHMVYVNLCFLRYPVFETSSNQSSFFFPFWHMFCTSIMMSNYSLRRQEFSMQQRIIKVFCLMLMQTTGTNGKLFNVAELISQYIVITRATIFYQIIDQKHCLICYSMAMAKMARILKLTAYWYQRNCQLGFRFS